jgi:hypothetical protein
MPALSLDQECFFIAPIGADGSDIRNRSDGVLEFIVARSSQELGLQVVRADQIGQPGQITLQVIEHVLGAKAAVADLTGQNANVYYELAIRHTARLPIVLIAEEGEKLPFDIAQMRTIFFRHTDLKSADECRRQLAAQLREAVDGNFDSPIATAVDLRSLERGDAVARSVAELVSQVDDLTRQVGDARAASLMLLEEFDSGRRSNPEIGAIDYAFRAANELAELARARADSDLEYRARKVEEPLEYILRRRRRLRPSARAQVALDETPAQVVPTAHAAAPRATPSGTPKGSKKAQ